MLIDNVWLMINKMDDSIIPNQEAHLWLSLHAFFTSESLRSNYEITQFRKKNLMQVN